MRSLGGLINSIMNDIGFLLESIEIAEQCNNLVATEEIERQKIIDSCYDHVKHLFELKEFDQRDAIFNEMQREFLILNNAKNNEAIQLKAAIKIQALCKGFLTRKETKNQHAAHLESKAILRRNYYDLWRINTSFADGALTNNPNGAGKDDSDFVDVSKPTN